MLYVLDRKAALVAQNGSPLRGKQIASISAGTATTMARSREICDNRVGAVRRLGVSQISKKISDIFILNAL